MNLNSKRFVVTLIAIAIWSILVGFCKFDLIQTASAISIVAAPYLTAETIRRSSRSGSSEV